MKTLLTGLIIFICTLQFQYSSSIIIEHVGEIDKPFCTIKITDEKSDTLQEGKALHYKGIVDSKVFSKLRDITSFTQGNTKADKMDFGTFKLTLYEKGMLSHQYFLDRKKAIRLLDDFIHKLKQENSNEELISYLEINKKRINY